MTSAVARSRNWSAAPAARSIRTYAIHGSRCVTPRPSSGALVTRIPAPESGASCALTASKPGCAPESLTTRVFAGQIKTADASLCEWNPVAGDLDFDCDVDLMDFAIFQAHFTGPNGP
jgi:hypothetical protein